MAESKQYCIGRHLRSAHQWLIRAEQSFVRDKGVRGELDLFLAQAELQHAQEINRASRPHYRYSLLYQAMAVAMAVVFCLAGWGGYHLWQGMPADKSVSAGTVSETGATMTAQSAVVQEGVTVLPPAPVAPGERATVHEEPVAANPAAEQEKQSPAPRMETPAAAVPAAVASQEVRLSPEEMQKLVRTAGKSLRGN
ncbi:MAG TPA: hypothetical protein VN611_16470 [Patescibacteria group bacterium]|nr:hypothetical protein [Patescibacteria group bacterium]